MLNFTAQTSSVAARMQKLSGMLITTTQKQVNQDQAGEVVVDGRTQK